MEWQRVVQHMQGQTRRTPWMVKEKSMAGEVEEGDIFTVRTKTEGGKGRMMKKGRK